MGAVHVKGGQMLQATTLLSFILLCSTSLEAQEWHEVSQEIAASQLLRKAEPVYPAFAKAAGVEGVVRIAVGIYTDGRIHSMGIEGGPPSLTQAAKEALSRYVYRPFENDGHLVNVTTIVDVVFKLPSPQNVEQSYPPPTVSDLSFSFLESKTATQLSPALQKWLDEDLRKKRAYFSCDASASTSDDKIIQVPVLDTATRLYIVFRHEQCMCGASGNCPLELVEVDATAVHSVIDSSGGEVALRRRKDASVPDIFSESHMSAAYASIVGFVKIAGNWGQLYCGTYFGSKTEESEIHVCQ